MSTSTGQITLSPYLRAEHNEQRYEKLKKASTHIRNLALRSAAVEFILAFPGTFNAIHSSLDAHVVGATVIGLITGTMGAGICEDARDHYAEVRATLCSQRIQELELSDEFDDLRFMSELYFGPDDQAR